MENGERKIYNGFFGINIHRANSKRKSSQVDKWSAGCQVLPDPNEFDRMLQMITSGLEKNDKSNGNDKKACQTYTLLDKSEIPASDGEGKWKGVCFVTGGIVFCFYSFLLATMISHSIKNFFYFFLYTVYPYTNIIGTIYITRRTGDTIYIKVE